MDLSNILNKSNTSQNASMSVKKPSNRQPSIGNYRSVPSVDSNTFSTPNLSDTNLNATSSCSSVSSSPQLEYNNLLIKQELYNHKPVNNQQGYSFHSQQFYFTSNIKSQASLSLEQIGSHPINSERRSPSKLIGFTELRSQTVPPDETESCRNHRDNTNKKIDYKLNSTHSVFLSNIPYDDRDLNSTKALKRKRDSTHGSGFEDTEDDDDSDVTDGSKTETTSKGQPRKSKRTKAPNSSWTSKEDVRLLDMVLSTLPKQDYENYARKLNKRDGQSIRYRLKVIVKRAKDAQYKQAPTTNLSEEHFTFGFLQEMTIRLRNTRWTPPILLYYLKRAVWRKVPQNIEILHEYSASSYLEQTASPPQRSKS